MVPPELSAWISNEFGIGIAPLSGIVVALVLACWFSPRGTEADGAAGCGTTNALPSAEPEGER